MNNKVIRMITEYTPFEQGDRVLVGLSGGADSVALLDFLWKQRDFLGIEVCACHVNHMLRGEESDHDEEFVRALCKNMGIDLTVEKIDVKELATQQKLSIEEAAREVRYRFFGVLAEKKSAKIATAHTLSDSMETIIFNLARGTGLRGLCGIPPIRGNIVRPLIFATRAEIESYIKTQGLTYVTDSTNASDDYTRNRIRHHVIPKLYELNENTDTAILRMIETLSGENAYLERESKNLMNSISENGIYNVELFKSADIALQKRGMLNLLRENGVEASAQRICELVKTIGTKTTIEIKSGIFLKITKNDFCITRETILQEYFEKKLEREMLLENIEICLFNKKVVIFTPNNCEQWKNSKKSNDCVLKNCVDYDKIYGDVVLRQRKAGDNIKIPERNLTKTLKKLFNEADLNLLDRSERVIIADDLGVIYAEGFGFAERVSVSENTKTKIFVSIWGERNEK